MARPGEIVTLDIERPAAGGRMIARHDGAIVFVADAIPGERVRARIEKAQRGTLFARAIDVLTASPDRIEPAPGLACGGHVLAHIAPARQARLKGEIVADAFRRQARTTLDAVEVTSGPADGYRVRARAHVRGGRWGFFEEGSHTPCGIAGSRQLSDASAESCERVCAAVAAAAPDAQAEVEWVESVDGAQAVAHAHVASGTWTRALAPVAGLRGLSVSDTRHARDRQVAGEPFVVDTIAGVTGPTPVRHHVRAFFQGNRFLLQALVDAVVSQVRADRVADLYAGVGLFSLALAHPDRAIDAVEGDGWAAEDLTVNAARLGAVRAVHRSVERFVRESDLARYGAVVVDPPRAGLATEVVSALTAARVPSIVYVSCDPVTLARDVRLFAEAGYELGLVRAFDLFPRTAHVETVAVLTRG
ncbi:MAG: TRAM domain-containing protein [Vicinamibacterales bacterium]